MSLPRKILLACAIGRHRLLRVIALPRLESQQATKDPQPKKRNRSASFLFRQLKRIKTKKKSHPWSPEWVLKRASNDGISDTSSIELVLMKLGIEQPKQLTWPRPEPIEEGKRCHAAKIRDRKHRESQCRADKETNDQHVVRSKMVSKKVGQEASKNPPCV